MSKAPTKEAIILSLNKDIEGKILDVKKNMEHLKESLNSETKSSMGDKYETSRSMIQAEIENLNEQFSILVHNKNVLKSIEREGKSDKVSFGSLIETNKGLYFIGIGIGKVSIQNQDIFCVSANSPIGQEFQDKASGDTVAFKGNNIKIMSLS